MNKKHVEIRNKVKELLDRNFSKEEIAKKLKLKIGKNSLEKGTVKWYRRCIEKMRCGKRVVEKLRMEGKLKGWCRKGGKATIKKLRSEGRLKEICRKGTFILIEKLKREGRYKKHQSKAGKRAHILHPDLGRENAKKVHKKYPNLHSEVMKQLNKKYPDLAREAGKIGGKKAIKKLKDSGRLILICSKGGKMSHILHPDLTTKNGRKVMEIRRREGTLSEFQSKVGKLGGKKAMQNRKAKGTFNEFQRKASLAALKAHRENKPYIFMNVKFDSNEERKFCKLLVQHRLIKKPIEGVNCHVKVDGIEIDFFPQQKVFVEYHPWDRERALKKYYRERRKILDENGYKSYPLVVVESLDKFSDQVLSLFKG